MVFVGHVMESFEISLWVLIQNGGGDGEVRKFFQAKGGLGSPIHLKSGMNGKVSSV